MGGWGGFLPSRLPFARPSGGRIGERGGVGWGGVGGGGRRSKICCSDGPSTHGGGRGGEGGREVTITSLKPTTNR